ncbi:MAG: hypothetical protein Fur006_17100 [Coleofasciculaceae cyanobacterium]
MIITPALCCLIILAKWVGNTLREERSDAASRLEGCDDEGEDAIAFFWLFLYLKGDRSST